MCINYKREIYVLAHLNLSTASFKCLSYRICFMFIINKHFNFCCFRALAYTTLDRLCAVFRSTTESRPNSIEGENVRPPVRPYVRPSVHKKFLQFE